MRALVGYVMIVVLLLPLLLNGHMAYSYPTSIDAIGLKWTNLNLSICITNAADRKYQDIFLKAVDTWIQTWPHLSYQLGTGYSCSINVNILKDYADYQDAGYLGTTQPKYNYNRQGGYYEFTSAEIIIPTKDKFLLLDKGNCCREIFFEISDKAFYETAVHEFGHALGLDHSKDNGNGVIDIMDAVGDAYADHIISSLTIQKLNEIYGVSSPAKDYQLKIKPSVQLDTTIDKESYLPIDTIHLSGKVSKIGGTVTAFLLEVLEGENGEFVMIHVMTTINPEHDGNFAINLALDAEKTFNVKSSKRTGIWYVLVQYMGVDDVKKFEINKIPYEVHALTDKTSYSVGETVKISGNVTIPGKELSIYVINPNGINFKFIEPDIQERKFSAELKLIESKVTIVGIWSVKLEYGDYSTVIHFEVGNKAPPEPSPQIKGELQRGDVSVAMKITKKLTLLSIKNNGEFPVFALEIKASDGTIRFVKVKDWDREKIDTRTVSIHTDDKPVIKGRNILALLLLDNKGSGLEWKAYDANRNVISSGALIPS